VMPPKSTYFFPKVLTGLVFNPLDGAPDDAQAAAKRRGAGGSRADAGR
jgi:hypothetical protein